MNTDTEMTNWKEMGWIGRKKGGRGGLGKGYEKRRDIGENGNDVDGSLRGAIVEDREGSST